MELCVKDGTESNSPPFCTDICVITPPVARFTRLPAPMEVFEDIGFGGVAPVTSVFDTPLADLPIPSLPLLPSALLSSEHPHPAFEQSPPLPDWSESFPHPHPSLPPVTGGAGQDSGFPSGHPGEVDEELDDEVPPDEELVLEELLLLELLLLEDQ